MSKKQKNFLEGDEFVDSTCITSKKDNEPITKAEALMLLRDMSRGIKKRIVGLDLSYGAIRGIVMAQQDLVRGLSLKSSVMAKWKDEAKSSLEDLEAKALESESLQASLIDKLIEDGFLEESIWGDVNKGEEADLAGAEIVRENDEKTAEEEEEDKLDESVDQGVFDYCDRYMEGTTPTASCMACCDFKLSHYLSYKSRHEARGRCTSALSPKKGKDLSGWDWCRDYVAKYSGRYGKAMTMDTTPVIKEPEIFELMFADLTAGLEEKVICRE